MTVGIIDGERKEKVSVIVNNFNKAKYIKECLDGIKNQTYGKENIELIIWEDNSTDQSSQIIDDWINTNSDFENVFVYTTGDAIGYWQSGLLPLGVTRWLALKHCTGNYVALCDSDDVWLEDKLEKQIPLFDDHVGIVYSDCVFFKNNSSNNDWGVPFLKTNILSDNKEVMFYTFHGYYPIFKENVFFNLLTTYNFMPASTLVFNKLFLTTSLKDINHYTSGEDYDWCLSVCQNYKVVCCEEALVYYRIVDESLTHNSRKSTRATWYEIDCAIKHYQRSKKTFGHFKKLSFKQHLIWLYCKLIWKQFMREDV